MVLLTCPALAKWEDRPITAYCFLDETSCPKHHPADRCKIALDRLILGLYPPTTKPRRKQLCTQTRESKYTVPAPKKLSQYVYIHIVGKPHHIPMMLNANTSKSFMPRSNDAGGRRSNAYRFRLLCIPLVHLRFVDRPEYHHEGNFVEAKSWGWHRRPATKSRFHSFFFSRAPRVPHR